MASNRKLKPLHDELTAHASAIAALCVEAEIAHLEIGTGDNSAVTWQRFDVPMLRDNGTMRIHPGKIERF